MTIQFYNFIPRILIIYNTTGMSQLKITPLFLSQVCTLGGPSNSRPNLFLSFFLSVPLSVVFNLREIV